MDVSVLSISIICLVGLFLGAMGAIIGSTLLVIVPMLSFVGLPIQAAIGTAKVSVIGREVIPAVYFHSKKLVKMGLAIPFSTTALITSWYGSVVALSLNTSTLETIVGGCMIIISAIILINPKIGLQEKKRKITFLPIFISIILGALTGFYTGIFGGGANVFIIFGFILIFGHTFLQASASSKLPNLLINAISVPMFIVKGFVNWEIAIPLTLSTAAGSYFGARLAVEKGNKFIRALFVGLVFMLAFKYLI
jgi:uncharacterized membrane protein YfcA